jgi:N4-gp56 family major capsid protein
MADFTVNMTGTVQVPDTAISLEAVADFIVAYQQTNVVDQFVEYSRQIGAKSIAFPRFDLLAPTITPLNEREDITSAALSESNIILTPQEYGNVVTATSLADIQSGGNVLRAAVQLVARNMADSMNLLATRALEATTNVITADGGAEADLTAGDVLTREVLNKVYNKLARANVPKHSAGYYVALLHEDVISDLRESTAAGSWVDVSKYNNEIAVLNNEVGMLGGFRIVQNNSAKINVDGGAGAVDTYKSSFLGFNGLGKAESIIPEMRMTGPFDKLGRFVNIGWYGILDYKIIEPTAVYTTISASGFGNNA